MQLSNSIRIISILLFLLFYGAKGDCYAKEKYLEIKKEKDLHGGVWKLPKGITLLFNGGIIKNGTIVGSHTKIKASGVAFENVKIRGIWDVKKISTSLFRNLDYENSLRDVFSLANAEVKNEIVIESGDYVVSANKEGDFCIPVVSNTDVIINGIIRLKPNSYRKYDILKLKGENINISGRGTIIGDRHSHIGTGGEWGMGVRFHEVTNGSINGLTIKDCWGDCVYVGGNSKKVTIDHCVLDHGRRQGISITKADGVIIKKCVITNISGTNPQYAIDIEPNRGDIVTNVLIDNVIVKDCEGGFSATRSSKIEDGRPISWIGNIVIQNCTVSTKSKYPIYMRKSRMVNIEKCVLSTKNKEIAIFVDNVSHVKILNNALKTRSNYTTSVENIIRKSIGKVEKKPITVVKALTSEVRDNRINE